MFQVCVWEGSWWPNITEIFWPRSYGRQRCVFLVLHGCSTGALAFLTTSHLPPQLYSPVSTGSLNPTDPELQLLCSIRRPYITFKLPRSNIDTPQRLRNLFRFPATGMCHFLPVHHLEWHFWPGQQVKTKTYIYIYIYIYIIYIYYLNGRINVIFELSWLDVAPEVACPL